MNSTDEKPVLAFLRLTKGIQIILLTGVVVGVLAIFTTIIALQYIKKSEKTRIQEEFNGASEHIEDHERYLIQLAAAIKNYAGLYINEINDINYRPVGVSNGLEKYTAQTLPLTPTFDIYVSVKHVQGVKEGLLQLGLLATEFSSTYWSSADYSVKETYILNSASGSLIAIPSSTGRPPASPKLSPIAGAIMKYAPRNGARGKITWRRLTIDGDSRFYVAYLSTYLSGEKLNEPDDVRLILAVITNERHLQGGHHFRYSKDYDLGELHSPNGNAFEIGNLDHPIQRVWGDFGRRGFIFSVSSLTGWHGRYRIPYSLVLNRAKWSLIALAIALVTEISLSLIFLRWYFYRMLERARIDHLAVAEQESFGRAAIEAAQVGMVIFDHLDRRILESNHLAKAWFKEKLRSAANFNKWFIINTKGKKEVEINIDGRSLICSSSLVPYGSSSATLYTFKDVTSYKLAISALHQAKQAADAMSEANASFVVTASHEIRTPLYGLMGTLELLELSALTPLQKYHLQRIKECSQILFDVIGNVLDVTRINGGDVTLMNVPYSPMELTESVLQTYVGMALTKRLDAYAIIDPCIPHRVHGDATRIRQILGNLLSNAIKFTEEGSVSLSVRLCTANGAKHIEWRVADTGKGIPENRLTSLFEASSHGVAKGSGFGLEICQGLAKLMKGIISVDSTLGAGSTFMLRLPLTDAAEGELRFNDTRRIAPRRFIVRSPYGDLAECVSNWIDKWGGVTHEFGQDGRLDAKDGDVIVIDLLSAQNPDVPPKLNIVGHPTGIDEFITEDGVVHFRLDSIYSVYIAILSYLENINSINAHSPQPKHDSYALKERAILGLKILVVDDNPINQAVLQEQLQSLGCEVRVCGDGSQALAHLDDSPFDAVLTDLNMPLMDGFDLCDRIKERHPYAPVVGVSANQKPSRTSKLDALLTKPVSIEHLSRMLELIRRNIFFFGNRNLEGIDAEFLLNSSMVEGFLRVVNEDVVNMQSALASSDLERLQLLTHRMYGGMAVAFHGSWIDALSRLEADLASATSDVDHGVLKLACRSMLHDLEVLLKGFPNDD